MASKNDEGDDLASKMTAILSESSAQTEADTTTTSTAPPLPPTKSAPKTADERWKELSKLPLFMNELDPDDEGGDGGEGNVQLEALRALAYEGTPYEVAANFREQGNEAARARKWGDAREFYGKGVAVLRGVVGTGEKFEEEGGSLEKGLDGKGGRVVEVLDEEEEREREGERRRGLEEVLLVNRGLANLEMSV
ncbi:hypothetical protein LTS18_003612 [Coniosporium uncinatum]|uniref:Uncharacterized protein n=1 Tax=Coniosporium uncinatum TaxID=93489 RepID=A0ACC3DTL6_9PEZI|nr:hypothetical protein LTS18_003612 [Coniosporium uncinatum]